MSSYAVRWSRWWRRRRAELAFPPAAWAACRATWADGEAGYTRTFGERVSMWRCWYCSLDDVAQDGWVGIGPRIACADCARSRIRERARCARVTAAYRGRMGTPRRALGEVYHALVQFKERRDGWMLLTAPLARGLASSVRHLWPEIASTTAVSGHAAILAPVPSYRGRRPHVRMLTAVAAVGLPHMDVRLDLLVKTIDIVAKDLSRDDRRRESASAYAVCSRWRGGDVEGRVVVLTDDFMTTGATLEACAAALMSAGALAVYGAAVVRVLRAPGERVVSLGSRQVVVRLRELDVRGRLVILDGEGTVWVRFACGARGDNRGPCAAVHTAGPYALPRFADRGVHRWVCRCGTVHQIRLCREWLGEARECVAIRVGGRRPAELLAAAVQGPMTYL